MEKKESKLASLLEGIKGISGRANKKIAQKIELLKINDGFNKDIKHLRKKWKKEIKIYQDCVKKSGAIFIEYQSNVIEQIKKRGGRYYKRRGKFRWNIYVIYKKKKKNKKSARRQLKIKEKPEIKKDLFEVAEKYKLYPLDYWGASLNSFLFDGVFWDSKLYEIFNFQRHRQDSIGYVPKEANFTLQILEGESGNEEKKLAIIPFDDSSLIDIKKYWSTISNALKELKKEKEIKKRYYPLKNLIIAKKLKELDKREKSDWKKQEEIYGEIGDLNFGKEEKKRKNRIKQIRYQFKKRLR